MRNKFIGMVLTLLLLVSAGCRPPAEYAEFAKAGTLYTAALDNLLVAATKTHLDASSERLLSDDEVGNTTDEAYQKQAKADRERIQIHNELRRHARLLGLYFDSLYALATSTAPEQAQQHTEALFKQVNTVGETIRGSKLFSEGVPGIVGLLANAIVNAKIRGELKKELQSRKAALELELETQKRVLRALSRNMSADLKTLREKDEQRLIVFPLLDSTPIKDVEKWKENRRKVELYPTVITELEAAAGAIEKLEMIFAELISGKITPSRINSFLADLETILSIAESIRKEF